jgi:hypothetical protein
VFAVLGLVGGAGILARELVTDQGPQAKSYAFACTHGCTRVVAVNDRQQMTAELVDGALQIAATSPRGPWRARLRWATLGRDATVVPVALPVGLPRVKGGVAHIVRADGTEEWFANGPEGIEQGFVLPKAPDGPPDSPVSIQLDVDGDLIPRRRVPTGARGVVLDDRGSVPVARYDHLTVRDAEGRELRSWFDVADASIVLHLEDRGARYPISVDPTWAQQFMVAPSTPRSGEGFGELIAIDGDTLLVSGAGAYFGRVYSFQRTGGTWMQTQTILPSDSSMCDAFGGGDSLSLDGDNMVTVANGFEGCPDDAGTGAYLFHRAPDGGWAQEQKVGTFVNGSSAAVSGNTAVINGQLDVEPPESTTVSVYVRQCGSWQLQQQIVPTVAGGPIDISGDTFAVGSLLGPIQSGAVAVYVRNGTVWSLQQVLIADDAHTDGYFGSQLSLSGDTLAVGGLGSDGLQSVYVFTRSGGIWSQQQRLTTLNDGGPGDGFGAAFSVRGATLVVGAPGNDLEQAAAYVFQQNGTTWNLRQTLTFPNLWFGVGTALSNNTIAVGFATSDGNDGGVVLFTTGNPEGSTCSVDSDCADYKCIDGVCCDACFDAGAGQGTGGDCATSSGSSAATSSSSSLGSAASSSASSVVAASSSSSSGSHGTGGTVGVAVDEPGQCGCRAAGAEGDGREAVPWTVAAALLMSRLWRRRHAAS